MLGRCSEPIKDNDEKALDCRDAVGELNEKLGELYQNRFDAIQEDYENQLAMWEHLTNTYDKGLDELEERGFLGGAAYYKAMQEVERQNIEVMKKELADLQFALDDAVNSGNIEVYSEAWYGMQQSINDVEESLQEANISLIEYENSLRQLEWDKFDYLQDRISQITEESDFLINLMSNKDLFDEQGNFNDLGEATLGMHGVNYNTYMAQADKYAEELQKINADLAKDPYNTDLIERREELLGLQRDSIIAAEDEKQAIVDLVQEGIDKQIESLQELVDSYKDGLNAARDLYDYQKRVGEQTSDIAKLQKQLAAYEGDNSEENRARVQDIKNQLKEAQSELEETEYDQYIKDQESLLDSMTQEFSDLLNARLDDVDQLISDMIGEINANSSDIMSTLQSESSAVGYQITDAMHAIWDEGGDLGDVVTKYGDDFLGQMTTLNGVIAKIEEYVANMAGEGDEIANETVSGTPPTGETVFPNGIPGSTGNTGGSSGGSTPAGDVADEGAAPQMVRITKKTKVLKKNGKSSNAYGTVNAGTELEYTGTTTQHYYGVKYKDKTGWVNKKQAELVEEKKKLNWNGNLSDLGFVANPLYGYSTGGFVADAQKTALENGDDIVTVNTLKKGEAILTPEQAQQFSGLVDNLPMLQGIVDMSKQFAGLSATGGSSGITIGDVSFNIPIDHVEDYDDFVTQLQNDNQFEKLIQSMTVDRIAGGSRLSKYRVKM